MLNSNDWWQVISNYNQKIFPMQWLVMLVGVILSLYLIYGVESKANIALKAYLSFCNFWIGSVFFIVLGTGFPSPLRQIQGSLFIVIAILLAVDIVTKKTWLRFPKSGIQRYVMVALLIVVFLYPMVGIVLGRSIDFCIYPGTLPCATTAFTLLLFTVSLPRVNKLTYCLLLIWAIPFPPLVQIPKYHVYEDGIMFLIGLYALYALIMSIIKSRPSIKKTSHKQV